MHRPIVIRIDPPAGHSSTRASAPAEQNAGCPAVFGGELQPARLVDVAAIRLDQGRGDTLATQHLFSGLKHLERRAHMQQD